jgi:hypothetical protein
VLVIRRILLDGASTALRAWRSVAAAALLTLVAAMPAHAGFCPGTTSCTLQLNENNGFTSGTNFGTVSLNLTGHTVTIDVSLSSAYRIITTGFPGAFGFSSSTLAGSTLGGLTIGNFKTGGVATSLYSGKKSDTTNDLHFDGFGYTNNAAATNGPARKFSLQEISFTVSKGSSITDVNQLVKLFSPEGGAGKTYFVVDACTWVATSKSCSGTGLLGTNKKVPEPASLVLLGTGLVALGIWRRRKLI